MKKKFLITMMTALIVCISSMSFAAAKSFSDVPTNHWAYNDVMDLANNGILSHDEGTFEGDRAATRYEVAVMIANIYSKKTGTRIEISSHIPFIDLPENHWAAAAVCTLESEIIIEGYEDATFLGNRKITRAELEKWLLNLLRETDNEYIIKSTSSNTNENITRYELAAVLNKIYKVLF